MTHHATARSQIPILVALCHDRAAARLYTYRAAVRYPCTSSRWEELLSARIVFIGVRPRDRTGPKTKQNGPPNKVCDRASEPCDHAVPSGALKQRNPTLLPHSSHSLPTLFTPKPYQNPNSHTHTTSQILIFVCAIAYFALPS
ncbi:hypothetical protein PIB30_075001, partial [Stylosanthes scabra]|nr:hypothetical protein [Stylosanthes scabra]